MSAMTTVSASNNITEEYSVRFQAFNLNQFLLYHWAMLLLYSMFGTSLYSANS